MFDLARYWYRKSLHPLTFSLLPFSWLFGLSASIRRRGYRSGLLKTQRFPVPVLVVGNITVGGTGKTPLVIWLAKFLQAQGYRPGIVSRGVGGKQHAKPHWVQPSDSAAEVGDEAILLSQNTDCPVVVGVNRVAVVRHLLSQSACDIIISDDGLQHYRLHRDIEIAVVDGMRGFGNQCLLPAGPLREPQTRLRQVDFVIVNGKAEDDEFSMMLESGQLISLTNQQAINLADFPHKKIHAIAGIGHPERFFISLKNAGFEVIPHVFPDHYLYRPQDIDFTDSLPIFMTEKDAVKCKEFADKRCWYLPITVKINNRFEHQLLEKLKQKGEVNDDSEEDFAKHACRVVRDVKPNELGK